MQAPEGDPRGPILRAMAGRGKFPTRAEAVADHLRKAIVSGDLDAGTRLRQVDIAAQLGVSTTPVREAFVTLVREGLLSGDAHRGVTVMQPRVEDMLENYEIRTALESLATEKAARAVTDADLEALDALLERMEAAGSGPVRDVDEYVRLNDAFHERIYAVARSPQLFKLIAGLREQSRVYLILYAEGEPEVESAFAEHRAIVDALRSRAPARAAQAMRKHLAHSRNGVAARLRP
jgi:DNA-binding GntR family transcriptional regulator